MAAAGVGQIAVADFDAILRRDSENTRTTHARRSGDDPLVATKVDDT
jgi:hypothetical protein